MRFAIHIETQNARRQITQVAMCCRSQSLYRYSVYCKGCDVVRIIKLCERWNIATVDRDWADRKVLFVVYLAKVLRWLKVHSKFAMSAAPQVAMRNASQIWQIFFPSQTLQVFCFFFAKPSDFLFGPSRKGTICSSARLPN
jgi:hypothetical protein